MSEFLSLRRFGPIQKADIELRDLTVFVGPQATGKSIAAQSLYFLRKFETLLRPHSPPEKAVLSALEWWFGVSPSTYAQNGAKICRSSDSCEDETGRCIIWDDTSGETGIRLGAGMTAASNNHPNDPAAAPEVYIPAGRTLYSFLPPYSLTSRVLASEDWPGYILNFYETLGRTINWLHKETSGENNAGNFSDENNFLYRRIESIFKGKINYQPDTISLQIPGAGLHATNIAAGQMEIWPFWAITEAGIRSGRTSSAMMYFEEPEAHLHPEAQHNVMEMVAFLVKRNTRFLITTHSPFILYAINNFLLASKIKVQGGALPEHIPAEIALSPDRVSAYRFTHDGVAQDIMDRETGLIDEAELDQVADNLGQDFSEMQDRLEDLQ